MKKVLKIILLIIWTFVFLFCHLGLIATIYDFDFSLLIFVLILCVIWWFITLLIYLIKNRLKKKRYNENFVTIEYVDDKYGKIIFKHDLNQKNILAHMENIVFDNDKIDITICIDDNLDLYYVFKDIKEFCNNAKKIKERIYPELTKYLSEQENYDIEGNIIEVNEQFVRNNLKFSLLRIDQCNIFSLWCFCDSFDEEEYSIIYDLKKDILDVSIL